MTQQPSRQPARVAGDRVKRKARYLQEAENRYEAIRVESETPSDTDRPAHWFCRDCIQACYCDGEGPHIHCGNRF